jgi:hypothetical protein
MKSENNKNNRGSICFMNRLWRFRLFLHMSCNRSVVKTHLCQHKCFWKHLCQWLIDYSNTMLELITVAARSKAWSVFTCLNTGIMGSNPTRDMDVCVLLFCVCALLCVGIGLATGWSPVQGVLPKAWTVFGHSTTGIVGSNPTRDMDVCVLLFCICALLCVGSGFATGWSPVQRVLPTV